MVVKIPYQNTTNKLIFDYVNSCSQQLSNVNFATDLNSKEAKDTNKIYIVITEENKVYLFCALSCKNADTNKYEAIDTIWVELADVEIEDRNRHAKSIYLFDLKKFFSTMSFATNYRDRDIISLYESDNNNLTYKISETINVDIAICVDDETCIKVINQFNTDIVNKLNSDKVDVMSVTNVDKNSFLLPYFNHKECLNFAVALASCKAYICKNGNNGFNYFIVENKDNNNLQYMSCNVLRNDKFNLFNVDENVIDVSTGLWLMFVVLQNSKVWSKADVYINRAEVTFKDMTVYHFFDRDAKYKPNELDYSWLKDYKYVGKLRAEEIFTLNKLFTNAKNSYFDFSRQKFIGCNYVFDDNARNEDGELKKTEIDFTHKCDSGLPLKMSFAELKHYIGTDLSQKTFVLRFYTNGTEIIIEKWDKDESKNESMIVFNHTMSKTYLGS